MAEYSERFAEAVQQALRRPDGSEWSTREVSKSSRGAVSPTTVLTMKDGKIPGTELIVQFGLAVGRDPNELLDAAGIWWLRYAPKREEQNSNGRRRGQSSVRPRQLAA